MLRRVRVTALSAVCLTIALCLVSACSAREPAPELTTETPAKLVGAPSDLVDKKGGATGDPMGAPAAGSTECTPAGVIGVPNPSVPGPFSAPFTGSPAEPLGLCGATDWDIQIHSRDASTWRTLESMNAQHGPDCGAPPSSHHASSYFSAVFQCRDHLMTAINAGGYGVIYLTPNQLFDFREGGTVTFDLSTEKMSTRDWWDVTISPWEENLAVPLLSNLSQAVDLNGFPREAIHIGTDNAEGSPELTLVKGSQVSPLTRHSARASANIPASVNQAASRQKFSFTVADGRMRFERLATATAPAVVFWDVPASASFDIGVVQFGHHSYTPTKDGAGSPATWHWDNIAFSQAIPFTMVRANERFVPQSGGAITFAQPAPENASLRFSAICGVKVNGQRVDRAPSALGSERYHQEHMSSYRVPVAAGATRVEITFEADDWYKGPCIAKDFAIWSK